MRVVAVKPLSQEQLAARVALRELAKNAIAVCDTTNDVLILIKSIYYITNTLIDIGKRLDWCIGPNFNHSILTMLSDRLGQLTGSNMALSCENARKEVVRLS